MDKNSGDVVGLEAGNADTTRTPSDINQAILAVNETDSEAALESGLPGDVSLSGVEGGAVPQSPEKVKRDFKMLVGLSIRLIKGLFAPAWPIPKSDIQELQELWADYLQEEYPQGVPATKLGFAIMATASLVGEHIDKPRFDAAKAGEKVGFWKSLFNALQNK